MRKGRERRASRARLTPGIVGKIVGLVQDWPADRRLTWDGVVAQAKAYLRQEWTRQGLERHEKIKQAFEERRASFREFKRTGKVPKRRPPEDEAREQRIAGLAQELADVRRTLDHYDGVFVRYQGNALKHGLTLAQLDAPLTPVDRRGSDNAQTAAVPGRSR